MKTINLEEGMPRVHEALATLRERLSTLAPHVGAAKLIHGYGSTGMGGAIREAVRRELQGMMDAGGVRYFIPGEQWCKRSKATKFWLGVFPALAGDTDLGRANPGVTIVMLRNPHRSGCRLPEVQCRPANLREALQDRGDLGHVVVKTISSPSSGSSASLKTALLALKKEGQVKHYVPGPQWTTADLGTRHWVQKFPQCDHDPDLDAANENISVVFLTRNLLSGSSLLTPSTVPSLSPAGRRAIMQRAAVIGM